MPMKAEEIVSLTQEQQLVWLKNNVGDFAQRSAEDPIGAWVYFDQNSFDDMIEVRDSYDLETQYKFNCLQYWKGAEDINDGAKLNSEELKAVKRLVLENDWENDGGVNASGFVHTLTNQEIIYVSFVAPVMVKLATIPVFTEYSETEEKRSLISKNKAIFFKKSEVEPSA